MIKNKNNEEKKVKKTKTYAYWMSVSSAVLLVIVQILGVFKVYIETKIISDIISSVLGALVVAGIIIGPTPSGGDEIPSPEKNEESVCLNKENEDLQDETNEKIIKESDSLKQNSSENEKNLKSKKTRR